MKKHEVEKLLGLLFSFCLPWFLIIRLYHTNLFDVGIDILLAEFLVIYVVGKMYSSFVSLPNFFLHSKINVFVNKYLSGQYTIGMLNQSSWALMFIVG